MPTVVVEFYGLARLRAGRAELRVEVATVGAALSAADALCPALRSRSDNGLSPEYRVSIGGKHFTDNLSESLAEGDALILLGADAGG
jgi:molybdopterin converting factor small subunit